MASAMVELPPHRVDELPLPAEIRDAIHTTQQLPPNSPRRRARLHVATLLREYDPADLRAMLERVETGGAPRSEEAAAAADIWIERLLADEAGAIDALRGRTSGSQAGDGPPRIGEVDVPRLRQLLRNLLKAEAEPAEADLEKSEADADGREVSAEAADAGGGTGTAAARARRARSALRRYLTELLGDGDLDPSDP